MSRLSFLWPALALGMVGCAFVAGGALAQELVDRPLAVAEEAQRDVQVMCRVLAREGLGAGAAVDRATALGELALLGAYQGTAPRAPAEGFVVPGDGALFVLRTSDPVAPSPTTAVEEPEQPEPSAWDQAEAELEGRRLPVRSQTPRWAAAVQRYDEQRVSALRSRVLEQLARYGGRIHGLADDAHLTVLVVGSSGGVRTPAGATTDEDGNDRAVYRVRVATNWFSTAVADDATVLSMRVAVADCRAFAAGTLDMATFRARAVVAAY